METSAYYHSPIGVLKITAKDKFICSIVFVEKAENEEEKQAEVLKRCIKQLNEYFFGQRTNFSFPYYCEGTEFQQRVWAELAKIEYGKTVSYKDIALKLGDESLVRAVGSANGKNPISIVVPCHRVIGSSSKLVGYAGGLWRKQWLLVHEQKHSSGQRDLFDL